MRPKKRRGQKALLYVVGVQRHAELTGLGDSGLTWVKKSEGLMRGVGIWLTDQGKLGSQKKWLYIKNTQQTRSAIVFWELSRISSVDCFLRNGKTAKRSHLQFLPHGVQGPAGGAWGHGPAEPGNGCGTVAELGLGENKNEKMII